MWAWSNEAQQRDSFWMVQSTDSAEGSGLFLIGGLHTKKYDYLAEGFLWLKQKKNPFYLA